MIINFHEKIKITSRNEEITLISIVIVISIFGSINDMSTQKNILKTKTKLKKFFLKNVKFEESFGMEK